MSEPADSRTAALVVVSGTLDVEAITALVGVRPDRTRRKGEVRAGAVVPVPARETSWELRECGDRAVPLSQVVDALAARIVPRRDSLLALTGVDCTVKLSLVQWISEDDPDGPGFTLSTDVLRLLADLGGFVDVDQYTG